MPAESPPPPTGTSTTAASGTCSASSSPIVPCPEITVSSSYGWTKVAPVSSAYAIAAPSATPSRRRRAASMSVSVGPVVSVAIRDVKDLLHDLANGGQRVELTILNLVEQPPQLVVAFHRALEMNLRAC